MKIRSTIALLALAAGLCSVTRNAHAQIPPVLIHYRGQLSDPQGAPLQGTYTMTFKLYEKEDPGFGNFDWSETHAGVTTDANGRFDVTLNSTGTAGGNLANVLGQIESWLEITINDGQTGPQVLLPRQRVTSAAYALHASRASEVSWNGLTEVPTAFSDNTDDIGSAGTGLDLFGTSFEVSPPYRLPQTCSDNDVVQWHAASSTWQCLDPTTMQLNYSAGEGLALTGTEFHVVFDGDGTSTTVARSDHGHFGDGWVGSGLGGLSVWNQTQTGNTVSAITARLEWNTPGARAIYAKGPKQFGNDPTYGVYVDNSVGDKAVGIYVQGRDKGIVVDDSIFGTGIDIRAQDGVKIESTGRGIDINGGGGEGLVVDAACPVLAIGSRSGGCSDGGPTGNTVEAYGVLADAYLGVIGRGVSTGLVGHATEGDGTRAISWGHRAFAPNESLRNKETAGVRGYAVNFGEAESPVDTYGVVGVSWDRGAGARFESQALPMNNSPGQPEENLFDKDVAALELGVRGSLTGDPGYKGGGFLIVGSQLGNPTPNNSECDPVREVDPHIGLRRCRETLDTFWVRSDGRTWSRNTFAAASADFAELLPAAPGAESEPGDVLVVNAEGDLEPSTAAYASNVVGIYSTAPGFLAGYDGAPDPEAPDPNAGKIELAVIGIVPVKASDENGPIAPGDLLVASNTRGHAMRAGENPPQGTVIGKALAGLAESTGQIKALVTLQ